MKSQSKGNQWMKELREIGSNHAKLQSLVVMTFCVVLVFLISIGARFSVAEPQQQVFASSQEDGSDADIAVSSGLAGVVSGISETPVPGSTVDRLGTSFGQVMVGQRVSTVDAVAADLDVSESMQSNVDALDTTVSSLAANPKLMSDSDYDTLLNIVEAEAGSEDLKGRILVANVIMNRVKNDEFPDNVTDVVWERRSGVPQFSPTSDGTFGRTAISEETKEAVRQVMEGVDYSKGALFFIQKDAAAKHNVNWFDKNLKKLFKHGVHEFYTYPDQSDTEKAVAAGKDDSAGKDDTAGKDTDTQDKKS